MVIHRFIVALAKATPERSMLCSFKEVITSGDLIFKDFPHEKLGPGGFFELPQVFPPVIDGLWSMCISEYKITLLGRLFS